MRLTIPNQLTLIRIFLTPVFVYLFTIDSTQSQLIATIIFLAASITDWYDGWYARRFGVITRWGQFMDPLADKILVSAALILFVWMGYVKSWMVWVIIVRDFMVTGIRIYALQKGTPIVTHILAKWKTLAQMVTIFIVLFFVNWLNINQPGHAPYHAAYFDVIGISMGIVTGLTIISAVIYIYGNWELILRILKSVFLGAFR